MLDLTEDQIVRYSRHILLKEVGVEGQEKLMNEMTTNIGAMMTPQVAYIQSLGLDTLDIRQALEP